MSELKKYYLYSHIRLDKDEVFYVGIGTKHKIFWSVKKEYARAYSKTRNKVWKKITKKTKYKVQILLESNDYQEVKNEEKRLIKQFGRIDLGTGILANLTDGAEGILNIIRDKAWREKQSLTRKGRKLSKKWIKNRTASFLKNAKKRGFIVSDKTRKASIEKLSKKVYQYDKEYNLVKIWKSVSEARSSGFSQTDISRVCTGKRGRKTHKGYIWRFDKI